MTVTMSGAAGDADFTAAVIAAIAAAAGVAGIAVSGQDGDSLVLTFGAGDPTSLVFVKGFEPDFKGGMVERSLSSSSMYGGELHRLRVVSKNRKIQYMMFAARAQAWVIPPQALTTELSSYGVRTIDVAADEYLFVPGYEYHYMDDSVDPPELFSQIPVGYAGAPSDHDDSRADASAWLEKLPVIRELRRNL